MQPEQLADGIGFLLFLVGMAGMLVGGVEGGKSQGKKGLGIVLVAAILGLYGVLLLADKVNF